MGFRKCATCKKKKDEKSFSWKDEKRKLRHYVCIECHAEYKRAHYLAHRQKYIAKAKRWNRNQKIKLREVLYQYLSTHPCIDCGERDILVLDFDHRSEKYLPISTMFRYSYSIARVMDEINKCDVRCANCHRRKTAQENRNWKLGYKV